jgi:hypothetical protein
MGQPAPQMPTTIATRTRGGVTYVLFAKGELWTTGKHAYMCGYVSDPKQIALAIDAHEEEMACLTASAQREFAPTPA